MIIVVGVVFMTLGVTYDGIDIAIPAGIVLVAVGIFFSVIQHRMAKALKT
ncbi:MAG: hypothetical protein V4858_21670 [Pseudomonadota bacterium]